MNDHTKYQADIQYSCYYSYFVMQADNSLQMEKKYFHQTALDYVFKLQEVNEKKKFEFVESVSTF